MLKLATPLVRSLQAQAVAIDARVRAVAPGLRPAHVATWDERPLLVTGGRGPWVLVPFELDPFRTKSGGYPFAAQALSELEGVASTGVRFDRVAIAHQIPEAAVEEGKAKQAATGCTPISAEQAKGMIGALPTPSGLQKRAARLDAFMGKSLTLVSNAAVVLPATPLGLLDPIVFGVVGLAGPPKTGDPALYYPLAAWEW